MMNDLHRERVEHLKNAKKITYRTFFRRRRNGLQRVEVRDDDLAGCLRTAVGGSGKQFLIKVGGGGSVKMRAMIPREYTRLQGVPDDYKITIKGVQALTGFGDAVCVSVISLNRAKAYNAFNLEMITELTVQLTKLATDDAVKGIGARYPNQAIPAIFFFVHKGCQVRRGSGTDPTSEITNQIRTSSPSHSVIDDRAKYIRAFLASPVT
jgi:hypothetical protein